MDHDSFGPIQCTGACCLANNGCVLNVTNDACVKLGGRYLGNGTKSCAHDAAGDCIPTVSEWGLLILAMLLLCAGTIRIGRRTPIRVSREA